MCLFVQHVCRGALGSLQRQAVASDAKPREGLPVLPPRDPKVAALPLVRTVASRSLSIESRPQDESPSKYVHSVAQLSFRKLGGGHLAEHRGDGV